MARRVIFESTRPTITPQPNVPPSTTNQVERLEKIVHEAEEVIYQCSSVFPFDFFPDKIVIDKTKVTLVENMFMFKRTFPIPIKDVLTVRTIQGILFSSLELEVKGYEQNPPPISHLWPWHATRARQYIMGLLEAKKEGVDLSFIPSERTNKRLKKIGQTQTEES